MRSSTVVGCGCQECAAHDAAMQAKFLQKGKTKMQVLLEVLDVEVSSENLESSD